jgi:succinate dehydrogenase flavin-adding protein (antitoxin of CptAB toxin-antitoxin module)
MFEIEVPPRKYPLRVIERVIEEVLRNTDPELLEWVVNVEQPDDTTLRVHMYAVN